MYFTDEILALAARAVKLAEAAGITVTTAESCTGGLIAAALTEVSGASSVFNRGFVTYANDAKAAVLGVDAALIARVGAVNEEVARQMAEGACRALGATGDRAAVAVTGIAGPGGGSAAKPVGLVHLAAARPGQASMHESHIFPGDRAAVRTQAVAAALRLLLRIMVDKA